MNSEENYLEINRQTWNDKVDYHVESEFYGQADFRKGKSSLRQIELDLLGDVSGKKILHLQCHFGQDTISLARMGASTTGADLSDKAIAIASKLAAEMQADAKFISCDVYNLPEQLDEKFDIVFTSYGTIGWLPDLDKWAKVISHFLKPGGKFVFAEFHPVIWMFDDYFKEVAYNYFKDGAIIETNSGTYADKSAPIKSDTVSWNHALSEVFSALLANGLLLEDFQEYDYSPYNCFNEMIETEPEKFRIRHLDNKIPMVYSLVATKK